MVLGGDSYGAARLDRVAGMNSKTQRNQRRAILVMAVAALGVIAVVAMVTNRHDADPRRSPVTLAQAAAKTTVKTAAKAKVAKVATAAPLTKQEKVEAALRANLDKTAKSIGEDQLQPLLMRQGATVLHSKTESKVGLSSPLASKKGISKPEAKDLHSALAHARASESQKTENSLRQQLDNELKLKEKAMFKASLQQARGNGPRKVKLQSMGPSSKSPATSSKPAAKAPTEMDEEAILKQQLDAKVKSKEKSMYKQAFAQWNEKQHKVKVQQEAKRKVLAKHEKQLFEATLKNSKPMLAEKSRDNTMLSSAKASGSKPSFKTWLHAFKTQLAQRAKSADAKMVKSQYKNQANASLKKASESRSKAQQAVKALQKSLLLERKEEKEVKLAEDKQEAPGKALAKLQATMKQERSALSTIKDNEQGAGADPNLAALAPKHKAGTNSEDALLGLDDLNYM